MLLNELDGVGLKVTERRGNKLQLEGRCEELSDEERQVLKFPFLCGMGDKCSPGVKKQKIVIHAFKLKILNLKMLFYFISDYFFLNKILYEGCSLSL